jgi:LPXTG-motif cell wall-anchored protein
VTIHDDPACPGGGNAAKVTVPFSILITGLTPNSTTSQLFVTDKDAKPEIVYGPITIPNVDAEGTSCIEVQNAPAGVWKIDVVEEGSGFTDSKVFTIESTEPTTTTTTAPTTSMPTTTTTTAAPTTTTSVASTTTTTTRPPQSTTTTIPAEVVHRPGSELPWVIVFDATTQQPPPPTELPLTGAQTAAAIAVGVLLVGAGLLLLRAGRPSMRSPQ